MKISIIIPTYTRSDKLRECLASIIQYTTMEDTEILVVANGASEETKNICEVYREFPVTLLWFPEPLGYPRACNEGIKASSGEYVVLLNDDCLLLPQPRNQWIDVMLEPMLEDELVGLTGPLQEHDGNSGHDFLIFFCVTIRREVFDSIGMLDEAFSPYFGEDTDFCIRAVGVGWKMIRVPPHAPTMLADIDPNTTTLEPWKHDKIHTGMFPLFHDAESTIGHLPESEEILRRNRRLLKERYGPVEVNIERAQATDGWMAIDELQWLARSAKTCGEGAIIVEIGSWHGRSSRALADNLAPGAKLLCVDTWNGSSGEPEMHETAKLREGDHAHSWWWCNVHHEILDGKVIPVRMNSAVAAETLNHMGLKIDMLFIDADHSYQGIKTDVMAWAPLMKEGALWCGHDYYTPEEEPFAWIGVRACVNEMFPDAKKVAHSIWATRTPPEIKEVKPAIYDCFPVNNELDLIELRFNELDQIVDRWVITEARLSHSNQEKPAYFQASIEREPERWARWLNRITHIIVDDFPVKGLSGPDLHWAIERHQRDAIMRGLTECQPNDVIIISDVDEIPRAKAIKTYAVDRGLCALQMKLYYGSMNCEAVEPWREGRILPYSLLKVLSPCAARYASHAELWKIEDAGWHFSFMGGPDAWVKKLENTAHQEYNQPEFKNQVLMAQRVAAGEDMLGRPLEYRRVPVDNSFPQYVLDNLHKFRQNQFLSEVAMHPEAYQFVARVKAEHPEFFTRKKVLEVGSLNINGTVRDFFTECDYHGIDLAEGNGVDAVKHVTQVTGAELWNVVISTEALEHDEKWRESLKRMEELLRPGGLLLITCAGPARPEHGTKRTDTYSSPFTTDYYRNLSKEDFLGALPTNLFDECLIGYERGEEDLVFWGIKHVEPAPVIANTTLRLLPLPKDLGSVTAEISTKDRYFTTLPLTIAAIANQTRKPEKLVIYDDGEQKDLRELPFYRNLLLLLQEVGIDWKVLRTPRQGQVTNHQHCLDNAETLWIWRIDDDEIPEADCLERLLNTVRDYGRGGESDSIGAVAGLVHQPGAVQNLPDDVNGSMADVLSGRNMQWYQFNSYPREVEHLYSTFLYRVEAGKKAGGYPKGLSVVGHREETIFSHNIKRAGYKLLVTPSAKTWHLREESGGIRSFNDTTLWERDEQVFQSYLTEWGVSGKATKLIVLDCGIGDHYAFRSVLPRIRAAHPDKELILAVCYPEAFKGEGLPLISIAEAKQRLGARFDESSIYKWCWQHGWTGPLSEAMVAMHA